MSTSIDNVATSVMRHLMTKDNQLNSASANVISDSADVGIFGEKSFLMPVSFKENDPQIGQLILLKRKTGLMSLFWENYTHQILHVIIQNI